MKYQVGQASLSGNSHTQNQEDIFHSYALFSIIDIQNHQAAQTVGRNTYTKKE
jgi:hypothetical protein